MSASAYGGRDDNGIVSASAQLAQAAWSSTRVAARRRIQQVVSRVEAGHVRGDQTGGCTARGIKDGGWVWVTGAEYNSKARMKALVTERVGKGVTWMPFHFAGWFQGVDQRSRYPKGSDPIVLGESMNTLSTYGFDPVTGMQEPKATLCQIRAA
jgi:hypothetical protein